MAATATVVVMVAIRLSTVFLLWCGPKVALPVKRHTARHRSIRARISAGCVAVFFIAVGGGVRAAARFLLDGLINTVQRFRLPRRNPDDQHHRVPAARRHRRRAASHLGAVSVAVLGTGVMGGYTTFSTASFETVRLARSGRLTATAVNGLGMLVVSVSAATVGILLGGAL